MNTRKDDFKKVLKDLNDYFVKLYVQDIEKYRARTGSYQKLRNILEQVVDGSANIHKLSTFCWSQERKFRGWGGGPQGYSTLLARLGTLSMRDEKGVDPDVQDLKLAWFDHQGELSQAMSDVLGEQLLKIKNYGDTLVDELEQEQVKTKLAGLFSKKIDEALSEKKHAIAVTLYEHLDEYINSPDEMGALPGFLFVLIDAERALNKALEGTVGKAGRLAGIIEGLKGTMKQYVPYEYDIAVQTDAEQRKQPKPNE